MTVKKGKKSPSPYKKGSTADKEFMRGYNRALRSQGLKPKRR